MRRLFMSGLAIMVGAGLMPAAAGPTSAASGPPTFPATTWYSTVPTGAAPKGMAASVVANSAAGTVTQVHLCIPKSCTPDGSRTETLQVGTNPTAVVQEQPYPSNYYVSNEGSNTVSVIDYMFKGVTATIAVGTGPTGMAISGTTLYVANNGSNTLSVIDMPSGTVVDTLPTGAAPWGVATDGTYVYVSNTGDGTVSVFHAQTRQLWTTIPVGTTPAGLDVVGDRLYVANNGSGTISVVDTAAKKVVSTLPAGSQPWSLADHDDFLFVANYGSGNVFAYDLTTGRQVGTFATGGNPFGLSVESGKLAITATNQDLVYSVPLSAPGAYVTWSSNKARRSVTGVTRAYTGATYGIVARAGAKKKAGACRVSGTTVRCTVRKLTRDRLWRVSVAAQLPWQRTPFGQQNKRFRF